MNNCNDYYLSFKDIRDDNEKRFNHYYINDTNCFEKLFKHYK